ncbi:MAG: MFS transporter [Dehalococcoidales bacterium]|nr:MFS transporter [Dehalococcoidales bacterium]
MTSISPEVSSPANLTKDQVKKSLKNSVLDGSFYSAMLGLTQNYTTPYALAMNASTTQVGFLTGIPYMAMVLTQLISPTLTERVGSRKGFILPVAFLNGLMWLPILLIPYIFPSKEIWWLIAFITLCTAFDALSNAPWNSMMADLVPGELRGRYFSSRNRINGLGALILSFVAGGILQVFTRNPFIGFSIIFAGAMVSRFASVYFLSQMVEPPVVIPQNKQSSIFKLSLTLGSTNIGKFILYNALINFAANFSGPFFSVYMLRDLKFNYLTYVIVNSTAALATLIFMPFWGKRIDRAGNVKVLKVASLFVPLVPIVWLFSTNVYYLCAAQVLSGFAWSGFNLAVSIFLYGAAPSENRTRYIALNNALMFAGISLGALLGGVVAPFVPALMKSNLLTMFLISGLARIVVVLIFIPGITEVRNVPEASVKEVLFSDIEPSNLKKLSHDAFQRLNGFRKKRRP